MNIEKEKLSNWLNTLEEITDVEHGGYRHETSLWCVMNQIKARLKE